VSKVYPISWAKVTPLALGWGQNLQIQPLSRSFSHKGILAKFHMQLAQNGLEIGQNVEKNSYIKVPMWGTNTRIRGYFCQIRWFISLFQFFSIFMILKNPQKLQKNKKWILDIYCGVPKFLINCLGQFFFIFLYHFSQYSE